MGNQFNFIVNLQNNITVFDSNYKFLKRGLEKVSKSYISGHMGKYDILIIGSGLGGLTCGSILSKEGYKVCILEQNPIIGGCLQKQTSYGLETFC